MSRPISTIPATIATIPKRIESQTRTSNRTEARSAGAASRRIPTIRSDHHGESRRPSLGCSAAMYDTTPRISVRGGIYGSPTSARRRFGVSLARAHLDREGFSDVHLTAIVSAKPAKTPTDHPFVRRVVQVAAATPAPSGPSRSRAAPRRAPQVRTPPHRHSVTLAACVPGRPGNSNLIRLRRVDSVVRVGRGGGLIVVPVPERDWDEVGDTAPP
jgi:hypothetical protein